MFVPIVCMRFIAKASAIALFAVFSLTATAFAEKPSLGDTWSHIAALPPSTHLHVASDKKGRTCFLISSDDEKLVCSNGKGSSGSSYTFTRAEVKSVKLTRYGRSTLVGLLVGGGAGAGIGAAVGLAAGGGIGGPTDWLRGPTIYLRAGSKQ